jgi:hypothetical protein
MHSRCGIFGQCSLDYHKQLQSNAVPLKDVVSERVGGHLCYLLCISFKMWKHLTADYSVVCCICRAT